MTKSSNWESTIKPILVLTLSSLVASLMLALVNSVTAPVIEANEKAATLVAYVEVLPTVSDATRLHHRRHHRRGPRARRLHRPAGVRERLQRRHGQRHHRL